MHLQVKYVLYIFYAAPIALFSRTHMQSSLALPFPTNRWDHSHQIQNPPSSKIQTPYNHA